MKSNRISLIVQEAYLKKNYPDSEVRRFREETLTWVHVVTPSPLGAAYKVKLQYQRHKTLNFYVVEPNPLPLAKDKKFLPHVYSTSEQRLCLYYPDETEWNVNMLFTSTIIPWAHE